MQFKIGVLGEEVVVGYMRERGFELVKQRYKTKEGEVDLVFVDNANKVIIFCEVKSTASGDDIDFENIITQKQWRRIINASQIFFADEKYAKYQGFDMRFDAFFVQSGQIVKHIENVIF